MYFQLDSILPVILVVGVVVVFFLIAYLYNPWLFRGDTKID